MHPAIRGVAVAAVSVALASATFTGLVGVGHTKSGSFLLPYLAQLPGMGGLCPLGFADDLTADQRDAARREVLAADAGSLAAASRPAMGFDLDRTTRDDIALWAGGHAVACTATKIEDLRCSGVPAAALGRPDGTWEVLFKFDAQSHLVAVDASSPAADADAALVLYRHATEVTGEAGPPALTRGQPDAAWLGKGALNQTMSQYRFSNYRADLTATNMGKRGVIVHESFQSI